VPGELPGASPAETSPDSYASTTACTLAAGLTSAQVAYQALIGVATLALLVLTAARLYESRRALTAVP